MSLAIRSLFVLALSCSLFPTTTYAVQLRQPASVLPLEREEPVKKRGIVAPQVDEVPQWLLQSSEYSTSKNNKQMKVARKVARGGTSSLKKSQDAASIGEIEFSAPRRIGVGPTKEYRPKISPSEKSLEGPVLRIPGMQRAKTTASSKRA